MKIAYVMQNYAATSELWLQRQLEMLAGDIAFIAATDGEEKLWNGSTPVVNLYSDYPMLKKILMQTGLTRIRSPQERYCEVLSRQLLRTRTDVILVNYLTLAYDLRELLDSTDLPIAIHTHGYDITWDLRSITTGNKVYADEYFDFARRISSKATIMANSHHSKELLTNIGIPEHKVIVKHFGVPIEGRTRRTPDGILRILYLGRLIDFKAPDLVIKAFDKACDKGMQGELIIAGDGYMESTCKLLQMRSKYKNRIKIIGAVNVEEGRHLRSKCDIFTAHSCTGAVSNQREAFGVAFIEAMSAGLPVVTGKSGGIMESVIDGETGLLFTPGDVDEHAEQLLKLANNSDLRWRMGENAIARVKQEFSLSGEHSSIITILRNIAPH